MLKRLTATVLLMAACFSGCRSSNSEHTPDASDGKDADTLISETLAHFNASTFKGNATIAKVLKSGRRFDDELKLYVKAEGQDRRILMQVKPQKTHPGMGLLAEVKDKQIVSAYRYIPESNRVVELEVNDALSNVVIGGLSIQELQFLQGVSPFQELKVSGKQEINGELCYQIDAVLANQSQSHHAQLFTTVANRLPVLMRVFNKDGGLIKEISIDKLESTANTWVVRQLTIKDESFSYTSTFNFENIEINPPLPETIFTTDYLKRGWQD
jgi:hypothetical protein